MNELTLYYEGREIGLMSQWEQSGELIVSVQRLEGLVEGMVIEISTDLGQTRTHGIVEQTDPHLILQLDETV